ncbi:CoA transferase [Actinomadura darangshiensis]|uniref:CoA transferase n=1 Tax=Actinomadura darangshiensis TaxID=705336 RepID=A0A4R5BR27_9ACTN|nr:CoA transferase [Actinomadura darangshiensis]TDD87986.1 CoA transferase [Actinomadura darangshiensis]
MAPLPLDGLRVLDLTRAMAGPYCTSLLGDLGADVVKAEALPTGDASRLWGPFDGHRSVYFDSANRNKRSIAVAFRSEPGRRLLARLAADADVIVENFRPGVLAAIGLDPDELRARRPELVIAGVTGYGPVGPDRDAGGLDQIAQGMSGLMSVTGEMDGGGPLRVGIPIIDIVSGMTCALGIAAAVAGRRRGGAGAHVQTSLLENALAVMTFQAQRYLTLGEVPGPQGNDHPVISPYGVFRTADRPVNIAVGSQRQWRVLCELIGAPRLADDPRFADGAARVEARAALTAELEPRLRTRPADEWIADLRAAGIPCGPIHAMDGVFGDPQVEALGMVRDTAAGPLMRGPLWLDGSPAPVRRTPPALGEHTREVLAEAGLTAGEIDALIAEGVVRQAVRAGDGART